MELSGGLVGGEGGEDGFAKGGAGAVEMADVFAEVGEGGDEVEVEELF
jgi:hypothetical protein